MANNQAVGGSGGDAPGGRGRERPRRRRPHLGQHADPQPRPEGATAADGLGGGIYNGAASTHPSNLGAPTVLTVEGSAITHNKAQGAPPGPAPAPATAWAAASGTAAPPPPRHRHQPQPRPRRRRGRRERRRQRLRGRRVQRGRGVAPARTQHRHREPRQRRRGGRRSDGEGIGGGVYNLGAFDFDALTLIFENHASTSHDDVFDPFA